ncbi:MAG TPA: hypothetical protein VN700_10000 [Vicinamibacterales bacterium]|nr:hypothetical protein [Vicinamibacterales bacterium]
MPSLLADPVFDRRLNELTTTADRVWLIGLSTGLVLTLVAAYPFAHTPSGNFWAYAGLLIRGGLYLWAGDSLRGKGGETLVTLFRVGLVAGLLEILIDWALIHWLPTGRLVYLTGNDVVLLGSPVWMPLAWACVIVELGYPALRGYALLKDRMARMMAAAVASTVVAIQAGVTIGFYEYFAYRADWWKYEPARVMLGDFCAVYIPLGEFFMFLPVIPIMARALSNPERRTAAALESGALFAAAIAAGYAVAYVLLEVR